MWPGGPGRSRRRRCCRPAIWSGRRRPFEFKAGESVRYIDFESGNDANDGLSKQTPWKHHPWDPNAGGKAAACKGVHTYVFKQGVDYRGEMNANESGTADAPIILTRDPSWGEGPAVICGSEAVTGWKKGADNTLIPEPEKVWYVDLDWAPRNVWMVGKDGAVTRIALARTPNWTITDPDDIQSEWWTWKNPDKPFDNYATINGQRRHLAFDKERHQREQAAGVLRGRHRPDHQGLGDGQPVPGQGPGRGPQEAARWSSPDSGAASRPTRSYAAAASTWRTSPSIWTAPASSGSTRRETAAGSTSACPATRTRTPPGSRWPSAST